MAVHILEEKRLERFRNRLNVIEKMKRYAKPVIGITNGTFLGSVIALGSVSAMHHVAGHVEFASRYLGATEALTPIALQIAGASAVAYGAIAVAEKIQQNRVQALETDLKWKRIMSIDNSEKMQSQQQEKTEVKAIAQEVVQRKEKSNYKSFSSVLKPRVVQQEHVHEHEMNME